ncbi:MAG: hypothetical protein UH084_08065 [Paludibacteraceae bacterium]|nr:hypothetical protein [Paludibacteraceae bacterium]
MKPRTIAEVEVFDKAEDMHRFIMEADQPLILRQANAYNQHGDLLAVYQKSTNNKHP